MLIFYFRHKAKDLAQYPTCNHNKKPCFSCQKLTMRDIRDFHKAVYSTVDKVKQDIYILQFCKGSKPKRSLRNHHGLSIKYFVPTATKEKLRVCKRAFLGITHFSADRLERLVRNHLHNEIPRERRGGDTVKNKNDHLKVSIRQFVENIQCKQSHYQRERTSRLFLPCDLNFRKLHTIYCTQNPNLNVKLCFFRKYVNANYNLSFGTPMTDVCSTCIRFKELLKNVKSNDQKAQLIAEQRVHTLKMKAFYDSLKSNIEGVQFLSFDCQKNLALPKLPDQSAYFSQQINLYNFTVVCGNSKTKLSPDTVSSYVWLETEYCKNSNVVASAVYNRLLENDFKEGTTKILLFADGCGGQNKNSTVIGMLAFWLGHKAPTSITTVELVFPVVGHSFIPPDRVFGLIERDIKRKSVIVDRTEYEEIIQNYSKLLKLGNDWQIFDWKTEMSQSIKKPAQWHFKFNESKRFILTKENRNVLVRGEVNYKSDLGFSKSVLKKGKLLSRLQPKVIEIGEHILKGDKSSIFSLLKKHFGDDWLNRPDLQFYANLQRSVTTHQQQGNHHQEEEEALVEEENEELRI